MTQLQRISKDTVALHFPARMDETTNPNTREVLDGVLAGDDNNIVLEFSKVEYLNSSAVGALLAFVANIRKTRRTCRPGSISEPAKKIMDAMKILPHLTVAPSHMG